MQQATDDGTACRRCVALSITMIPTWTGSNNIIEIEETVEELVTSTCESCVLLGAVFVEFPLERTDVNRLG